MASGGFIYELNLFLVPTEISHFTLFKGTGHLLASTQLITYEQFRAEHCRALEMSSDAGASFLVFPVSRFCGEHLAGRARFIV